MSRLQRHGNIFAARYNETQGSYRDRENNTALPQGILRGNAGLFPVPVICCVLVFVIELFV